MSNDLTSRLVADHALLIEKRLQDWQDGFRAGQEAMREAAAQNAENYEHDDLAAAIRMMPIKDAPDE